MTRTSGNPDGLVYNPRRNAVVRQACAAALALAQNITTQSKAITLSREALFATISTVRRKHAADENDVSLETQLGVARYLTTRSLEVTNASEVGASLASRLTSLAYNLTEEAADEYYGCDNDGSFLEAANEHLRYLRSQIACDEEVYTSLVDDAINDVYAFTQVRQADARRIFGEEE